MLFRSQICDRDATPSRKMELADPSAKKMRLPPVATPVVDPAPDSTGRSGDPAPTGSQEPVESRWTASAISRTPSLGRSSRFSPPRIATTPKSSQFGGALYGALCPLISTVVSYLSSMILKSPEPSSPPTRAPFKASASRHAT